LVINWDQEQLLFGFEILKPVGVDLPHLCFVNTAAKKKMSLRVGGETAFSKKYSEFVQRNLECIFC
jgi:hypothetical protein